MVCAVWFCLATDLCGAFMLKQNMTRFFENNCVINRSHFYSPPIAVPYRSIYRPFCYFVLLSADLDCIKLQYVRLAVCSVLGSPPVGSIQAIRAVCE